MTDSEKDREQKRLNVWVVLWAIGTVLGMVGGKLIYDKIQQVDEHEAEIREIRSEQIHYAKTLERLDASLDRNTRSNEKLALALARIQGTGN